MAARPTVLNHFIQPCDPARVDTPPVGSEWIHEIKWDGYRAQVHIDGPRILIYSLKGFDWTVEFPVIREALAGLSVKSAILDGEVVATDKGGKPDFPELRRGLGKKSAPFQYHAFDLLLLDGEDLRELRLLERKRRLRGVLQGAPDRLVYVEHMEGDSGRIFPPPCELGLEGIVPRKRPRPTARAGARPGANRSASAPTISPSSRSSRSSAPGRAASPRFTSVVARATGWSMRARCKAETAWVPRRCARPSTPTSKAARRSRRRSISRRRTGCSP